MFEHGLPAAVRLQVKAEVLEAGDNLEGMGGVLVEKEGLEHTSAFAKIGEHHHLRFALRKAHSVHTRPFRAAVETTLKIELGVATTLRTVRGEGKVVSKEDGFAVWSVLGEVVDEQQEQQRRENSALRSASSGVNEIRRLTLLGNVEFALRQEGAKP
jgi:hypothetical protein